MGNNELNAKVKALRELQQLIEEATAEADAIKDELKAYMIGAGTDEMTVGLFTLRYKTVASSRFDAVAFKAKYGDLYAQYTKRTETRRFTMA